MPDQIRCLIVDDERLAREGLAALLREDSRFVVVAEAAGGREALRLLAETRADVVFLDVQMPGVDGFEFLKTVDERQQPHVEVVFVTAFNDYAIRAFEAAALDYVLKPVDEERFQATLDRVARRLAERAVVRTADALVDAVQGMRTSPGSTTASLDARVESVDPYLTRFAVRSAGRTIFVDCNEVHLIEADGYCVKLHVPGRTHVLRATMTALEARLDPARFVRVHRSAIVNVDHVVELHPYDRGHYMLLLRSGAKVRMSRQRREQLGALFG
jgi:two-component system LytT family response regulator